MQSVTHTSTGRKIPLKKMKTEGSPYELNPQKMYPMDETNFELDSNGKRLSAYK